MSEERNVHKHTDRWRIKLTVAKSLHLICSRCGHSEVGYQEQTIHNGRKLTARRRR